MDSSVLVERRMANCTGKQVMLFIDLAEKCLIKDDGEMQSTVLETFGKPEGVEILRNLFGRPKRFVTEETTSNAQVGKNLEMATNV